VVSDVVCPWCFIGKRHLDKAIAQWRAEHPDSEVTVSWHPFFLNPDTPEGGEPYRPFLEKKFGGPQGLAEIWQRVREAGKPAGIEFAFEKIELRANTLAAHRLIHFAQKIDSGKATALVEALFAAQFLDGRHVGDRAILAEIAAGCGFDAAAVKAYLDSDEDAEARYARMPTSRAAWASTACPSSSSTRSWRPRGRSARGAARSDAPGGRLRAYLIRPSSRMACSTAGRALTRDQYSPRSGRPSLISTPTMRPQLVTVNR
jgi:predicted DsbA family dithiol-disulfide isomerase